jgi:hypothetical protein
MIWQPEVHVEEEGQDEQEEVAKSAAKTELQKCKILWAKSKLLANFKNQEKKKWVPSHYLKYQIFHHFEPLRKELGIPFLTRYNPTKTDTIK